LSRPGPALLVSLQAELLFELVDSEGWTETAVNHRVAVGTDRAKIGDRVDLVPGREAGKLEEVVDVDAVAAERAVAVLD
jgi:hypothetical protein